MSQDCYILAVEEVEDAIVDPTPADTQFVDAFVQIVGQWTAEFVFRVGSKGGCVRRTSHKPVCLFAAILATNFVLECLAHLGRRISQ
jgi:hypothetical protein